MEDDDIVVVILNGLPADFNLIKAIIRARESSVSIAELRILLLDAERDIANRAILNIIPSFSVTRTMKKVYQKCLSDNGNMSDNDRGYLNNFLASPQCQPATTSSPHSLDLLQGNSCHTHIGVSPAVVDGGEQNMINDNDDSDTYGSVNCSSDNDDSDGYGSVNSCGDNIGGLCFVGEDNSRFVSYAEIQYVDQVSNGSKGLAVLEWVLYFAKFEITKRHDCIDFIKLKQLCLTDSQHNGASSDEQNVIKATGGEKNKFIDPSKDKLGVCLGREDEMDSLVQHSMLASVKNKVVKKVSFHDLWAYSCTALGKSAFLLSTFKVIRKTEWESAVHRTIVLSAFRYLTGVYLNYLNFQDEGTVALVNAFTDCALLIKVLEVAGNDITVKSTAPLACCVAADQFLTRLILSENELKDEGANLISKVVAEGHDQFIEDDLSSSSVRMVRERFLTQAVVDKSGFKLLNINDHFMYVEGIDELLDMFESFPHFLGPLDENVLRKDGYRHEIFMSQVQYAKDSIHRADLDTSRICSSPLFVTCSNSPE